VTFISGGSNMSDNSFGNQDNNQRDKKLINSKRLLYASTVFSGVLSIVCILYISFHSERLIVKTIDHSNKTLGYILRSTMVSDEITEMNHRSRQLKFEFNMLSDYLHSKEKTCQNTTLSNKEREARIELLNDSFSLLIINGSSDYLRNSLAFGKDFAEKIDDTYDRLLHSSYSLNPCSNKNISAKNIINDKKFIEKETSDALAKKREQLRKLDQDAKKEFS
jgi:hypothetical protein